MKNNKGIIHLLPLLLVGVLIVAIGAGMYWYGNKNGNLIIIKVTPEPPHTGEIVAPQNFYEGWKTYSFPKIGFSFKVPPDWMLSSTQEPTQARVELKIENDFDPHGQYYMHPIISGPILTISPKDEKEAINGYFLYNGIMNQAAYKENDPDFPPEVYKKYNIKGRNMILATREDAGLIQAFIPIGKLEGQDYALILSTYSPDHGEMLLTILESFEFVE